MALRLFEQRGFGAVTVDEIAWEAQISPRTFYRYFPAKEDVLQVHIDKRSEALGVALSARSVDEPPLLSLRLALTEVLSAEDSGAVRRWIGVVQATPSVLKAVVGGIQLKTQRVIAEFFASAWVCQTTLLSRRCLLPQREESSRRHMPTGSSTEGIWRAPSLRAWRSSRRDSEATRGFGCKNSGRRSVGSRRSRRFGLAIRARRSDRRDRVLAAGPSGCNPLHWVRCPALKSALSSLTWEAFSSNSAGWQVSKTWPVSQAMKKSGSVGWRVLGSAG